MMTAIHWSNKPTVGYVGKRPSSHEVLVDYSCRRQLEDYCDFLRLVYGHRVAVATRPDYECVVYIMHQGMSETGIRVAGWLYKMEYKILRVDI